MVYIIMSMNIVDWDLVGSSLKITRFVIQMTLLPMLTYKKKATPMLHKTTIVDQMFP
jgi:hypothetical protein